MQETTKVIAVRVHKATYDILLDKSNEWKMSVSSLLREVVTKVFNDDSKHQIKSYKIRHKKGGNNGNSKR